MDIGKIVPAPGAARDAADFVVRNLSGRSATEFFSSPDYNSMRTLAKSGSWAKMAPEYRRVTGANIKESVVAAEIMKRLYDSGKLR